MYRAKEEYVKFIIITFIWTWGLLAIPICMHWSFDRTITKVLFSIAGIAPSSTGIILACTRKDKKYRKDFIKRIINFKQIRFIWYLILFAFVPVSSMLASGINYLFTNEVPDLQHVQEFISDPLRLLGFAVYMLLFGPIAEEIGWRGYALDHLEKCYGWMKASIILGLLWSLWHLPMFFIQGTYQYTLLNSSIFLFIDFSAAIFAMSIIMGWIYNNNHRSILSGILLHFCTNFFGEIMELPEHVMYWRTAVQAVIALLVLVVWIMKHHEASGESRINRHSSTGQFL